MSKALIAAVLELSFAQCLGTGRNYARWAASNSGFAMSKQQGPRDPDLAGRLLRSCGR